MVEPVGREVLEENEMFMLCHVRVAYCCPRWSEGDLFRIFQTGAKMKGLYILRIEEFNGILKFNQLATNFKFVQT